MVDRHKYHPRAHEECILCWYLCCFTGGCGSCPRLSDLVRYILAGKPVILKYLLIFLRWSLNVMAVNAGLHLHSRLVDTVITYVFLL
jgi:hypothetical protein